MDEEHKPDLESVEKYPAPARTADGMGSKTSKRPHNFEPVGPDYYRTKRSFHPFLIIVVLLLLAAAAIYWFLIRAQPVKAPVKSSSAATSQSSNTSANATTHYDSSNFNLGFDYPKNWKLSDIAGSGKLTLVSTPMQLKTANGQTITGQAVLLMRDTTQPLSEFTKGNATAVADSEKISYAKPTQTQRANTYISFLNYASSSTTGLDGVYVTGDAGYQKDQAVPSTDIVKIQPVIDVTFLKCSDSKCTGTGTPLTLSLTAWNDANFSKPVKSVLQSLSIQ